MKRFGQAVVRHRVLILVLAILLLIPSVLGMQATRINYDMLDYLPADMETVQGQQILLDDFGKGAFSFIIIEDMPQKDVALLKERIEQVEHVETVLWYDSILDISVPMELLPQDLYNVFNSGNATMMAVFFDTSTSADETMQAVSDIRALAGKQCFVSGLSAMVTDLKNLCEREEAIYVGLAVACALAVMMLLLDSWLAPIVFLMSMGITILYNMGSNYFLGEISYISKALAAVLQLAVTMDYSIFLWHSYWEQRQTISDTKEAMAKAVSATIVSVAGSSITTIAGFLAMCFMSYTMGADLGIVMAKGVVFGVLGSVTILPALILQMEKPLQKSRHKALLPNLHKVSEKIVKHHVVFLVIFVLLAAPAFWGYTHTPVFYDFTKILSGENMDPEDMPFLEANEKLSDDFGMAATHIIIADSNLEPKAAKEMLNEIEELPGVEFALGMDSLVGSAIPQEMIPAEAKQMLKGERYQMLLISSAYRVSTDDCNAQIDSINAIIKRYDPSAMLIGEAPCTKDLIEVTDRDFSVVSMISIAAIFLIIALVLKSISLPVILVMVIEFAVAINLGIPYFANNPQCFITPICISTIQLGATVDYAILMTTRYKQERSMGRPKKDAVTTALQTSLPSVLTSALGFFGATFGVALYSNMSIISDMCNLMARGAIISMLAVALVLPAMFMLLDKMICVTSLGFKPKAGKEIKL
ncbi:MAG: RND family transporter [Faecousia sp.]